jgi:hypothetical protein
VGWADSFASYNKARSVGPRHLPAQPLCLPKGVGRSCALGLLGNSRDRQIRVSSVVVGVAGAGTWGQVSIGTFRWVRGTWGGAMDGDRAVQADQRHARNVTSGQECWSRGLIVSALLAGAQGGCRPSADPPNPVGITMDPAAGDSKSGGGINIPRY